MKKWKPIELNRRKYVTMAGQSYKFRSKNAIFFSGGNTVRHELGKALVCYQIKKWGEPKLTPRMLKILSELEQEVKTEFKGWVKVPSNFITEAVPKLKTLKEKGEVNNNRRIDVVRLEDETWFELELNKKISKDNSITFYL